MDELSESMLPELIYSLDTLDMIEPIEMIPKDVLQLTLGHLDDESLAIMCMANQNFARNICNDTFWLNKLERRFMIDINYADLVKGDNTYWGLYNYLSGTKLKNQDDIKSVDIGEINQLISKYKQLPKKRRALKGVGFNSPVMITDTMINFLGNADFGPLDPENPNSPPFNRYLLGVQIGVVNYNIIQWVMKLYFLYKIQQQGSYDAKHLTSTPEMDKYFENTYAELGLNPRRLRYKDLVRLTTKHTIPRRNLSEQQKNILTSPEVLPRLNLDMMIIRRNSNIYSSRIKNKF